MKVTTRKIALRGQLSPTTSLKVEQLNIRREKCKSTIQQIMGEIYQEENKNSKIIKYLTQSANPQLSQVSQTPKLKLHTKHESMITSIRIPQMQTTPQLHTTSSIDAGGESPRSKVKKFDLEIEDPNILNIYQLSAGRPFRRLTKSKGTFEILIPQTGFSFDEDLRKKKEELEKYMLSNTDVMAKIHLKQDNTEKMNLIFSGSRKGKNSVKLETIKKRFIKVLNRKNIERLNKINEELAKELNFRVSSPKIELRKSSSLLSKKIIQSPELFNKAKTPQKPFDIKSRLKKMIHETEEKQVVKLTTIEKIKEKYEYSNLKWRKLDLDLVEKNQKSPLSPKKSCPDSPDPEIRLPLPFFGHKQKNNVFLTNLTEMKSPKKKFEVFYNDLNGYYSEEIKDRWDVEKEISHQVKVYDEELKKINARLFEFNANLDKEFDKEYFESGAARFSSIKRAKRKR